MASVELLEIPFVICSVGEVGVVVLRSLCFLSRSRRLSCVCCLDLSDCLSLVLVWCGRTGFQKGFLVSCGK